MCISESLSQLFQEKNITYATIGLNYIKHSANQSFMYMDAGEDMSFLNNNTINETFDAVGA